MVKELRGVLTYRPSRSLIEGMECDVRVGDSGVDGRVRGERIGDGGIGGELNGCNITPS